MGVKGTVGYQVSDYYKNYFSGVLADNPSCKYIMFATREGNNYGSTQRYYLVFGEDISIESGYFKGTNVTIYECYTEDSLYYQTVTQENINMSTGNYMYYSNLGNYSDIRGGGTNVQFITLLLLIASMFIWHVITDIMHNVIFHRTGRRIKRSN